MKVKVTDQARSSSLTEGVEESGPSLPSSSEPVDDTETIQVSAGNPRVEHIAGLIHLYRELGERSTTGGARPSLPVSALFWTPPAILC